jgi:hypothetical protein
MVVTAIIHAMSRLRDDQAEVAADQPSDGRDLAGSLGLFLIPLVYAWLLPRTGFYLTTPFFLIALLLYAGERRLGVIAATTAIIVFCIYLVFAKLFYVALPVGNWPVFYDINNWLLIAIR